MSNPKQNRQRGKRNERAVAELFDDKATGALSGEDVPHELFSIECKSRKAFTATGWMDQAVKNCPEGKVPIVVVHVNNQRHDNDLVLMRMKDFKQVISEQGVCDCIGQHEKRQI